MDVSIRLIQATRIVVVDDADMEQPHKKANSTKEMAPRLTHAACQVTEESTRTPDTWRLSIRNDFNKSIVERHGRIEQMDCAVLRNLQFR
jgi:hypothetical protein